ncbi:MAG: peptidoglycan DD-metalloendopeptidase family protein [Patescibacteria group bacterium]
MSTIGKITIVAAVVVAVGAVIVASGWNPFATSPKPVTPNAGPAVASTTQAAADIAPDTTTTAPVAPPELSPPLPDALSRVTKKTFGLYVSPTDSPVSPERFTGYHTGVDFETTPAEQNIDVHVSAVCDGPLLLKEWASGYGGAAVQKCTLDKQVVTIIYGHLLETSITPKVGDQMKAGEQFAVLGKGYSQETDGERKHLHLGIHKGSSINILGYVQNKSNLSGWLDALDYLH